MGTMGPHIKHCYSWRLLNIFYLSFPTQTHNYSFPAGRLAAPMVRLLYFWSDYYSFIRCVAPGDLLCLVTRGLVSCSGSWLHLIPFVIDLWKPLPCPSQVWYICMQICGITCNRWLIETLNARFYAFCYLALSCYPSLIKNQIVSLTISASKRSIRRFVITEKAPTMAFS